MCDRVIEQAVAKLEEARYKHSMLRSSVCPSPSSAPLECFIESGWGPLAPTSAQRLSCGTTRWASHYPVRSYGTSCHSWCGHALHARVGDAGHRGQWPSTKQRGGRCAGPKRCYMFSRSSTASCMANQLALSAKDWPPTLHVLLRN